MKLKIFLLLILSFPVFANQFEDFARVERQNAENQLAQEQAYQNAQRNEQLRLERNAEAKRGADRRAANTRAESNRRALVEANRARSAEQARVDVRARENANRLATKEKIRNDERLADKERQQSFENAQAQVNRERADLETQRLKAQVDLDTAIAEEKIKRSKELLDAELKKTNSETDIIQSKADVDRTIAQGVSSNLTSTGNSDLLKFMLVGALILFVVLICIIWVVAHYQNKKKTNEINSTRY